MRTPAAIISLLAAALLATGCSRQHRHVDEAEQAHQEHGAEAPEHGRAGVTFSEKKGLHVPAATAEFIGLRIEDVSEQKVGAAIQFSAQVYRMAVNVSRAGVRSTGSAGAFASAFLSASEAAALRKGVPVTVAADGISGLCGRIAEVKPSPGTEGSRVEVIVAIDDELAKLGQGTTVIVSALVGEVKTVVAVPARSVLQTTEGKFVYTVSGEHFVRAPVRTGGTNGEYIEIQDGLYAGDQVVTAPPMTLWLAELQAVRGGKACADGD